MTENDRVLSALADEMNTAHAALSDLGVPAVLEGDLLWLPERVAWLNLTRPRRIAAPERDGCRAHSSQMGGGGGAVTVEETLPRWRAALTLVLVILGAPLQVVWLGVRAYAEEAPIALRIAWSALWRRSSRRASR